MCFAIALYLLDLVGIRVSYKLLLMLFMGGVLAWLFYEISVGKIVIASLVYLLAALVSETTVMGIVMGANGFSNFEIFLMGNVFRIQAFFMAKVIDLFILHIVFRFLNPYKEAFGIKEVLLVFMQAFCFSITIFISIEVSLGIPVTYSLSPFYFSVLAMLSLIAYFISFQLIVWYFNAQKEKQNSIKLDAYREKKTQYYAVKKEAEEDVRRIYHDLQNHLKVLAEMKEKRLDGLEEYVEDIQNHVQPFAKYHNSGNDAIDMILFEKKQLGHDIQVKVCRTPVGLSMLFQNPIDSYDIWNAKRLKTWKMDKSRHGFGMGNMERAVKSMGGRMNVEIVDKEFQLFVLIADR